MLKSMTGFGAGSAQTSGARVTVELSSVNRKQLDVSLRMPSQLTAVEARLQKMIQEKLSRGRVTGWIQVEASSGESEIQVDQKRAATMVKTLRASAKKLNLQDDLSAAMLLRIPGLIETRSVDQGSEAIYPCLEKALKTALKNLVAMRSAEGRELNEDFLARLSRLEETLIKIKKQAPRVAVKARKKLLSAMKSAGLKEAENDDRILREIALFGEKADVSEEITRLESHLKQFRLRLRAAKPVGRELDFLLQEFLREINTIGSKANDLKITREVVAFKTELERVREQVQNVE